MEDSKKLAIFINGKRYTLNHDESDEYVQAIGKFVNQKIDEASVDGVKLVEQTATVMACINITDELFKTRQQLRKVTEELNELKRFRNGH